MKAHDATSRITPLTLLSPQHGDLFQILNKSNGRLHEDFVACHVIAPLLSILQLLHSIGIVHRDIKTENCFLSASGELQLGDFGLAAHKDHDSLTERVGTLDYMVRVVIRETTPCHCNWCVSALIKGSSAVALF